MIRPQLELPSCLTAAVCVLCLADLAGAQAPPVPYGESNTFELNTNRVGFGDSGVLVFTSASERGVPQATVLAGAAPNPFNPRTTISFTVSSPGRVELAIYDLRGRCLRRLAAEDLDVGRHTRVWDGRTDAEAAVSAGVYLVRLEAGESVHSQKITLVK